MRLAWPVKRPLYWYNMTQKKVVTLEISPGDSRQLSLNKGTKAHWRNCRFIDKWLENRSLYGLSLNSRNNKQKTQKSYLGLNWVQSILTQDVFLTWESLRLLSGYQKRESFLGPNSFGFSTKKWRLWQEINEVNYVYLLETSALGKYSCSSLSVTQEDSHIGGFNILLRHKK